MIESRSLRRPTHYDAQQAPEDLQAWHENSVHAVRSPPRWIGMGYRPWGRHIGVSKNIIRRAMFDRPNIKYTSSQQEDLVSCPNLRSTCLENCGSTGAENLQCGWNRGIIAMVNDEDSGSGKRQYTYHSFGRYRDVSSVGVLISVSERKGDPPHPQEWILLFPRAQRCYSASGEKTSQSPIRNNQAKKRTPYGRNPVNNPPFRYVPSSSPSQVGSSPIRHRTHSKSPTFSSLLIPERFSPWMTYSQSRVGSVYLELQCLAENLLGRRGGRCMGCYGF